MSDSLENLALYGDNVTESSEEQLKEWVAGNSLHNTSEDMCCPDFSCCRPSLLAPEKEREAFMSAVEHADDDAMVKFLTRFLERMMEEMGVEVQLDLDEN